MVALWQQDLANVEAGVYPLPAMKMLLDRSRLFFEDLPAIHRRRESGDHSEVLTEETRGKRPRYYLQNFHFQSGGSMTDESGQRYDTQVEVLFSGAANATGRQALLPLREVFAGRDQRQLMFLDVGCGTGRFLDFVKQAWPRLPAIGLDLSEAYVKEAKRHLQRWSRTDLTVGNAESIPLPDESQDAVTSIFMFHELPPKVRRIVLSEFARVKSGGRLVLVDSLQHGDEPDYDGPARIPRPDRPRGSSRARRVLLIGQIYSNLSTRSGEEPTVLVALVFPPKGNFTKIGPFSETSPARTQLPDPLPDPSSWAEGPP